MARTSKKNLSFGLFSAKMFQAKENIIMGFFSELFFGIESIKRTTKKVQSV